jgi:hypothetical protein
MKLSWLSVLRTFVLTSPKKNIWINTFSFFQLKTYFIFQNVEIWLRPKALFLSFSNNFAFERYTAVEATVILLFEG